MNNKLEENFIDYIEGTLDSVKREELEKALAKDAQLKQSFLEYQHIVELEQHLAKDKHILNPNFVVKVMDRVEKQDSGFIWRLFMKLNVRNWKLDLTVSAAFATVCIGILVLKQSESLFSDSQQQLVESPVIIGEKKDISPMPPKNLPKEQIVTQENDIAKGPKSLTRSFEEPKKTVNQLTKMQVEGYGNLAKEKVSVVGEMQNKSEQSAIKGKQNPMNPVDYSENFASEVAAGAPAPMGGKLGDIAKARRSPEQHGFNHYNDRILIEPEPDYSAKIENTERYGQYEENPRIKVIAEPVSTFSIDVDTASYANARRFLSLGQIPPKDSVRIEEFINYFDYSYPKQTEKPFAVHYEIAPSPLDKSRYLLKVGVKAKDSLGDNKWNLVFLVDVSGSMNSPDKLDLVKSGLKLLVNKMKPTDRIALVTYAGSSGIALDSTTVSEKDKILNAIDGLASGGSTNGSGGIIQAYQVAKSHYLPGSVNRVVLATDGDFNVGVTNFDDLIKLIEEKRESGITLTSVGVGSGNINDRLLEQLADKGNGNYFYLDSFQEARKVFEEDISGNMEVVAKDVKLQIEFNPKQVLEYRLIGYDNRKLNKEDFNNDTIDAGEIGSGHTVTALYEVVLAGSDLAKSQAAEYRYQANKQPEMSKEPIDEMPGELAFLKVRYKAPEGNVSSLLEFPIEGSKVKHEVSAASDDFKFAAAVSYFGTILRDSKFKGNYSLGEVADLAEKSKGSDQFGYKRDFVNLVKNAQALKR